MIIFGEKLNSSIPSTLTALQSNDENALIALCKRQEEAGAHYLDINTAMLRDQELPAMLQLINLVQTHTKCGIMLDTPDIRVAEAAAKTVENGRPLIFNSVTMEERQELIPLAVSYHAGIVALPISGVSIPASGQERFENARILVDRLEKAGIPRNQIYIDLVVESIGVNQSAAKNAMEGCRLIMEGLPGVHTTCGLSNISFGIPGRIDVTAALLTVLRCAGLDSAIMDPSPAKMRTALLVSGVLSGEDEYCMDYIDALRQDDE